MTEKNIPKGLKKRGAAFWQSQMKETIFEDSHDLERLEMACKILDENTEAEKTLKQDGMFVKDRYGSLKEHPAVKVIRDNRIIFCRIVRELGLDLVEPKESRIPSRY